MGLLRRMQVIDSVEETLIGGIETNTGIKVGFASKDMITVNQHFGSADGFAVYSIDPYMAKLLEVFQFGQLEQDSNESKLDDKIMVLSDCAAVYCHAIGSSAAKQLLAKGVQPVKVTDNIAIKDLVELLQEEMHSGPSSWLARAIDRQKGPDINRFDRMEAEGWDE